MPLSSLLLSLFYITSSPSPSRQTRRSRYFSSKLSTSIVAKIWLDFPARSPGFRRTSFPNYLPPGQMSWIAPTGTPSARAYHPALGQVSSHTSPKATCRRGSVCLRTRLRQAWAQFPSRVRVARATAGSTSTLPMRRRSACRGRVGTSRNSFLSINTASTSSGYGVGRGGGRLM